MLASAAFSQGNKTGWRMVWNDEFNVPTINLSKWTFQVGPANVNSELEYYSNSPKNAFVDSGSLCLRAIKENVGGRNYTSAKLTTSRKGDWLYGRFEIRAKLNNGQGIWPAIWMMPTDNAYGGWPSSGEMDIMELLGHQPNKVYATVHWSAGGHQMQGGSKTMTAGNFAEDFHTFAYEWEPGRQRWYIDDVQYFTTARGNPFDRRFYLILNLAVGGSWPGNPNATTPFPNDMRVDFVRVYTVDPSIVAVKPADLPQGFSIASNPFQHETVLKNGEAESQVTLRDLSGRIVERRRLGALETRAFGMGAPNGIYLLEVLSGGQKHTAKLFKSR